MFKTVTLILLLTISLRAASSTLDGAWLGVVRTCNKELSNEQVRKLALSGGESRFVTTLLTLNSFKKTYSAKVFNGSLCKELGPGRFQIESENRELVCNMPGQAILSEGQILSITDDKLSLEGKEVHYSNTTFSGIGVKDGWKNIPYSLTEGVLILRYNDIGCLFGDWIQYFIPYPAF